MGTRARTAVRLACAVAFAAGCNALSGASDLSVGDDSIDAAVPPRVDPGVDAGASPEGDASESPDAPADADASAPFCDPKDDALLLCMPMENAVADQSKHNLQPSTVTGVAFVSGRVGLAGAFTALSVVSIPESPSMTSTALTVEAFVKPASLPGVGARSVIVDFDQRYSMSLGADGSLICRGGGGLEIGSGHIPVGAWSHVACTQDAAGKVAIYVNGVVALTGTATAISATGSGAAVGMNDPSGDNFDGLIDEVRVFTVARTPAQIAESAKRGQ